MDRETLLANLSNYNFYQTIDLGDGVKTPGLPLGANQKQVLTLIDSMDLAGKRVVDLGCANGLFALAAERHGAKEVIAVDHTQKNIEALQMITLPHLNSKVKPIHSNFFDFSSEKYGQFDLVIFAGLLYHLRYPFWALRIIKGLVKKGGSLILEAGIYDDFNTRAVLYCPSPADSPQRSRGNNACSFFNEKALRETMQYFGFRVQAQVIVTKPARRLAKKLAGKFFSGFYPVSNIVLHCVRDDSLLNEYLIQFYESTTP
jgi:SAM-dependent methyltransferase